MSGTPPANSHWLKLRRAREHLEALDREIGSFLELHPYETVREEHADGLGYEIKVSALRDPPPVLAILAGDALQCMRSALDHLAYSLAVSYSGAPLPASIAKASEFPIFSDPAAFNRRRSKGSRAGEPAPNSGSARPKE